MLPALRMEPSVVCADSICIGDGTDQSSLRVRNQEP